MEDLYIFELQSNKQYSYQLDLSCSVSGSVSVNNTIIKNSTNELPTWVSLDAQLFELNFLTPSASQTTNYSFGVQTQIEGDSNTYYKYINIQVSKTGKNYPLNICIDASSESLILSYTLIGLVVVTCLTILSTSLLNLSSIQSLWTLISHHQLLMLLPLLPGYLPSKVSDF